MKVSKVQDRLLKREYYDSSKSGSYQSPFKFYQSFKSRHPKSTLTLNKVKQWMEGQDTYTLNREIRTKMVKPNIIVDGINDIWEADLADLRKYEKLNDGYKYLLGVVDVFSRKLYVRPLKNKYSFSVIQAFQDILKESGQSCNKLRTDMGSEFTNEAFQSYLSHIGISHYYSHGTSQCAYIERVWKTIKKRIIKLISKMKSNRYIDKLQSVISSYNKTMHSMTGFSPNEVSEENESEVRYNQYVQRISRNQLVNAAEQKQYRFEVGDKVRIAKRKERIQTEHRERWTREPYIVLDRVKISGVPMYQLIDMKGEVIDGRFYEHEMQKIQEDKNKLYEIENVLKSRKRMKLMRC